MPGAERHPATLERLRQVRDEGSATPARLMADRIPGARLALVDGGHHFPLTHPEWLADEIDAFLTSPVRPPRS